MSGVAAAVGVRPLGPLALWAGFGALTLLLAVLAHHVFGVLQDYDTALGYKLQLDYGEGIVWQQALLMFTHRAYTASQALPFIVFHYPPVYYLAARAMALLQPDMLAAGRLVSMVSTLLCAPLIAAIVLTTVRRPATAAQIAPAIAAGMIVIGLHAVRNWAVLMRVDMLAAAIGLFGLWLGIRAQGRFWPTTIALLVCMAAVFTKQTQLPAGIAVFAVALIVNPRGAIGAALIAGGIGAAIVLALQWATGGFLLNIIGYNINAIAIEKVWDALRGERTSAPLALAMAAGLGTILIGLWRGGLRRLRAADPVWIARAMILVHVVVALLLLVNLAKHGSSYNYFIDSLAIGCVLIGVALCEFGLGTWR
ncbi:MAG TPA: hypothetical protein VE650_21015, partial [Acetobacteraceae bacterium]|nr:hypothetical protein [Acetobacteraceae bacterium]